MTPAAADRLSVVIPHRGSERLPLLAATLVSLAQSPAVGEIIVAEIGTSPLAADAAAAAGARHLFIADDGPFSRARALMFNALSGLASVAGGVIGYFVVGPWEALFPYLLVVASSSFIYVAVADLLPQLQQRLSLKHTLRQVVWLATGLLVVAVTTRVLHVHAH